MKYIFKIKDQEMNIQVHTWIYGTFEGWSKKTEMSMKVNGRTIKPMEFTCMQMAPGTKATGMKTNNIGTISVQINIRISILIFKFNIHFFYLLWYIKKQLRVQIILRLTSMRSLTERRIQNILSIIRLCL